jgi:hypothetical protein
LLWGEPKAPLHGVLVVVICVACAAGGWFAGRWAGTLLAPAAVTALLFIWWVTPKSGVELDPPCDDTCGGVPLWFAVILLFAPLLAFAAAGRGAALLKRRVRRTSPTRALRPPRRRPSRCGR